MNWPAGDGGWLYTVDGCLAQVVLLPHWHVEGSNPAMIGCTPCTGCALLYPGYAVLMLKGLQSRQMFCGRQACHS